MGRFPPLALNAATLREHGRRVAVPTYDRRALEPAVVHISVGSFHRSHQAVYFDTLAQERVSSAWGLVGVGLHRPEMRDALTAQDGLFTVVARGNDRDDARVIGAIRRYVFAPEQEWAVVDALADRRTRLVTLTVTGAGYTAQGRGPGPSALAYLVEALDRRRRAGLPGFTVMSCDNITGNGRVARTAVVGLAAARDDRLASWIEEHVAFPSSMVDRITPRTTDADRRFVAERFGIDDRWPVVTEPFSQWVVEDAFSAGRPPLEEVGVQIVSDVRPYALAKTRLLNGGHCALGYLGALAGHERTDAAMDDPVFARYVARLMGDEVAPLLPVGDLLDLDAYRDTLVERLANRKIGDRLARLCRNGSAKVPVHVVPSIVEARGQGRPHRLLTTALAGWCRYLRGVDDRGRAIELDDPRGDELRALARAGGSDPRPLLARRDLFGALGDDPAFVAELTGVLRSLDEHGARATVALSGSHEAPLVA